MALFAGPAAVFPVFGAAAAPLGRLGHEENSNGSPESDHNGKPVRRIPRVIARKPGYQSAEKRHDEFPSTARRCSLFLRCFVMVCEDRISTAVALDQLVRVEARILDRGRPDVLVPVEARISTAVALDQRVRIGAGLDRGRLDQLARVEGGP